MNIRTYEGIQELIEEMHNDRKQLIHEVTSLLWHMRGGLSREEAWAMSIEERKICLAFINERIKIVEKTRLPLL